MVCSHEMKDVVQYRYFELQSLWVVSSILEKFFYFMQIRLLTYLQLHVFCQPFLIAIVLLLLLLLLLLQVYTQSVREIGIAVANLKLGRSSKCKYDIPTTSFFALQDRCNKAR